MARREESMQPTTIRRRDSDAELLEPTAFMEQLGEVFLPGAAEPPILGAGLRSAVHAWLTEQQLVEKLKAVKVKPRTRALFRGPPGCGKTTLAHHIAARLGRPMLVVEAAALTSKYVGQTGEQIVRLFRDMRPRAQHWALFLDEIDAMATKRGDGGSGAEKEQSAILIALLQQFDRYDGLLFAATNRSEILDPAIARRFDLRMEIGLPEEEERFAILTRYLEPLTLPDVAMDELTERTRGASPALLRQLMEGVKRDAIVAPMIRQPTDAAAVFARLVATLEPPEDMERPPLWDGWLPPADFPWPPTPAAE